MTLDGVLLICTQANVPQHVRSMQVDMMNTFFAPTGGTISLGTGSTRSAIGTRPWDPIFKLESDCSSPQAERALHPSVSLLT